MPQAREIEKNKTLRKEMERIKGERRQLNMEREKRKQEYKKIKIILKNNEIDCRLKEHKAILNQNQEFIRKIDVLKHDDLFKYKAN